MKTETLHRLIMDASKKKLNKDSKRDNGEREKRLN